MPNKPENLSRYIDEAFNMVMVCDTGRKVTYINSAGLKLLGIPRKLLIGKDILNGIEEHSRSLVEDLFGQALNKFDWHGELLLLKADSSVFPAYVSASPIMDDDGNVERVLVIAHDISQRKKLEEDIRKRAELASTIIRTAPVGIFSIDTGHRFMAVNKAFGTMMGIKSPTILLDKELETMSEGMNPEIIDAIYGALDGTEIMVANKVLRPGEPESLIVNMSAVPIDDLEGDVEAVLVLIEDRTEMMKVEEQLLQADKLASTGFLAAGIAHEINNPIAGIYAVIDVLAKRIRREGGNEEPYQMVLTNIDRVKDIIRRLLDFANPAMIQPRKSDLNYLVQQVLEFFKFHPIFRKIDVEWHLDDELPEITVDPKQIQQIFHNLAMNAAQAMKGDGGRLEIHSEFDRGEGDESGMLRFRVRDTGGGIPEESLKKIFDPFYTTKPPGEGTGLGLSVSYSIAKHHGGELSVRNHPEGGAEFTLELPVEGKTPSWGVETSGS